jgi:hypothetical protein
MKAWMSGLVGFALLPCAHAASAADADFERIDRNGDQLLSWTEYKSRVMEIFYFSDLDNDGRLDRQEIVAAGNPPWSEVDADGNGDVATLEFVAFHKRWFQQADRDADGALSVAESGWATAASNELRDVR